jgi:hypothetical protein
MNGKLQESASYLKGCSNLEAEIYKLYETLSRKINQPESSFVLGLAYDSLKCAKTLQVILDYFGLSEIQNLVCKKNFSELTSSVTDFPKKIAKTNNVNYEMTCQLLKELSGLEDQLSQIYANYTESAMITVLSEEFSPLVIDCNYFKKIFEAFKLEKQKHKETILDVIYVIETKEAERFRNTSPHVKYQNPDAWTRDSTIHSFANPPAPLQQQ